MVFPAFGVYGQEGRMETDRPDQAETAYTVKRGFLQTEVGLNRNQSFRGVLDWQVPLGLIKYGISNRFELRHNFSVEKVSGQPLKLFQQSSGFKWNFFGGKGLLPMSSILVQYHYNDVKRDRSDLNATHHSIGEVIFTFQSDLNDRWGIGYNVGPEFHSNGSIEWVYRIAPGFKLGRDVYIYAEVFGRFPDDEAADQWFDLGGGWYVNDDLRLDMSAGRSLNNQNSYLALGASFRIGLFR